MKATGIVRRIDDLGRVVIPKEIRRTLRIREGDPLEIYTDREGEVILKKYSMIGDIGQFAKQYADALAQTTGYLIIGDGDCVIIGRGANYAFSDRPDKVSVFLSGDKAERIKHIADVHNISERKAKVVVNETDSRRAEFHKYCSNQEWGNAAYYDMCIDETRIGADGVVGIIKEYINNCMFDK